mmetsp:Transcript_54914/g.178429  ORF Transcript_54914/g.178429 Transcript_54914/m.178429 type:complete len:206 (-) Transcript_54914:1745-2362(-)
MSMAIVRCQTMAIVRSSSHHPLLRCLPCCHLQTTYMSRTARASRAPTPIRLRTPRAIVTAGSGWRSCSRSRTRRRRLMPPPPLPHSSHRPPTKTTPSSMTVTPQQQSPRRWLPRRLPISSTTRVTAAPGPKTSPQRLPLCGSSRRLLIRSTTRTRTRLQPPPLQASVMMAPPLPPPPLQVSAAPAAAADCWRPLGSRASTAARGA